MKFKRVILIFGIVIISLFLFITPTRADSKTTVSQKTAAVLSSNPDTNFGNDVDLVVGGPVSFLCITYIHFDITDLPSNIQKVSLVLEIYDLTGSTMDLDIYIAADTWTESAITWNNRPSRVEYHGSISITQATEWTIGLTGIDLTQYGDDITFELDSDSTDIMTIRSDDTSFQPELIIEYTPEPVPLPVGVIIALAVGIPAIVAIVIVVIVVTRKKAKRKAELEEKPIIEPTVEKQQVAIEPTKPAVEKPPIITQPVKPIVEKPPIIIPPVKPVGVTQPTITEPVKQIIRKANICPTCGSEVESHFCIKCGIDIHKPELERKKVIQDIQKVFQASGIRIDLEMLRDILPMDDSEFNRKIFELAERFGFKIELEILHVNKEMKEDFINALIDTLKA